MRLRFPVIRNRVRKKMAPGVGRRSNGFIRAVISVLFMLWIGASMVSSQTQQPKQSELAVKIDTNLVVTDAQVVSKKTGRVIGDLKPEDFLLYEDGVRQEIAYFSQDKLPLSIMLLLDVSGSVSGILKQIQDGALQALQRLKPEDEVAVMVFAAKTQLLQDFTKDRTLIADQIGRVKDLRITWRPTFLNEAVYQAAAHLGQATNPINRRVIVAVTDDASNQLPFMGHSEREATEELFESGSVISGLLVRNILFTAHYQVDNLIKKGTGRGSIVKYAKKTGGETMSDYEQNVAAKLAEVIDRARLRYSLGYYPTNSEMDGRFRKLKLEVTPQVEAREDKVVVRTRQGYYARRPVRGDNKRDK